MRRGKRVEEAWRGTKKSLHRRKRRAGGEVGEDRGGDGAEK
jgi:hypothetical protein